jgi:uncharacterized membrane protein YozB (DUF420 family)
MDLRQLPALNALLNSASAVLLLTGYILIRQGKRNAHRWAMTAALTASVLFLTSYLVYHAQVGSVRFQKTGWIRPVYFTILISHTILAACVAPMAIVTVWRAWRGHFDRHRRLARITLPLWLYVSVTGVVIYLMLYRM